MERSSAAVNDGPFPPEASSSTPPPGPRRHRDDRGDVDLLGDDDDDDELLDDDPLHGDLDSPRSFKRKQKPGIFTQSARFLSSITGSRHDGGGSSDGRAASPAAAVPLDAHGGGPYPNQNTKDGEPLDWHVEGPGRRVGYEDLTAIDWIFEYTKERQRLRVLASSASGIAGYAQQLLDASQVWVILVLTGLAVGAVAAGIDVASDWLGDLKTGYCSAGPDGGAFYLNRGFCCWGYDEGAKCVGWTPWAAALGIASDAGKWFIEYFFFVGLSVSMPARTARESAATDGSRADDVRAVGGVPGQGIRHLRQAQRDPRDQDVAGRLRHPPLPGDLDAGHQVARFGKTAGLSGETSRLTLFPLVSGRGIGHVAGQGRPSRPRRLLLCQPLHQAVPHRQLQRG